GVGAAKAEANQARVAGEKRSRAGWKSDATRGEEHDRPPHASRFLPGGVLGPGGVLPASPRRESREWLLATRLPGRRNAVQARLDCGSPPPDEISWGLAGSVDLQLLGWRRDSGVVPIGHRADCRRCNLHRHDLASE